MLKPDLTLQAALSQLKNPESFLTWELTAEDPYTVAIRQIIELTNEILKKKLAVLSVGIKLIGHDGIIFKDTKEAIRAKNQRDKIEKELTALFKEHFSSLMGKLIPLLAENMPHHQHFINMIHEMLLNAIEHGSEFCEIGNVLVNVWFAVNGVLCTITQPRKGPDLRPLQEAALKDESAAYFQSAVQSDKTGRGNGLRQAIWKFYPLLGFEDLGENGARAIILETRERVLQVDEEMRREVERRNKEFFKK